MTQLTLQERKNEVDLLIDDQNFENNTLVFAFTKYLYKNSRIDECIEFVETLLPSCEEKYRVYYRLWLISLKFLRGYYTEAKAEYDSLSGENIDSRIAYFYEMKLGFGDLYKDFVIKETPHFIFHIHPNRVSDQADLLHKIERREMGVGLVAENFFGIKLERKIHYFLWDGEEMKKYFPFPHVPRAYPHHGFIQEGYCTRDWHESTHVYNYLYGMERSRAFVLEGLAVYLDGRKGAMRLSYARNAYKNIGTPLELLEWWKDSKKFRNADGMLSYAAAGYFVRKLCKKFGEEKLLKLARYQTYEDACRIYGEPELLDLISETEREITSESE